MAHEELALLRFQDADRLSVTAGNTHQVQMILIVQLRRSSGAVFRINCQPYAEY